MALLADLRVTTEVLWRGALPFAVVDLPFVAILVRRSRRVAFAQLKRPLLTVTLVFWFGLWLWAVSTFWEAVYGHVFPTWARWWLAPLQAALACLVAWVLWWLACRVPGQPALTFLLAGGAWGIASHVIAIVRGILEKPPMLRGASPVAAVTLAFFEFTFYWCLILTVALVVRYMCRQRAASSGNSL